MLFWIDGTDIDIVAAIVQALWCTRFIDFGLYGGMALETIPKWPVQSRCQEFLTLHIDLRQRCVHGRTTHIPNRNLRTLPYPRLRFASYKRECEKLVAFARLIDSRQRALSYNAFQQSSYISIAACCFKLTLLFQELLFSHARDTIDVLTLELCEPLMQNHRTLLLSRKAINDFLVFLIAGWFPSLDQHDLGMTAFVFGIGLWRHTLSEGVVCRSGQHSGARRHSYQPTLLILIGAVRNLWRRRLGSHSQSLSIWRRESLRFNQLAVPIDCVSSSIGWAPTSGLML